MVNVFWKKMEGKKVTHNDHFAVFTSITKDTYINKKMSVIQD